MSYIAALRYCPNMSLYSWFTENKLQNFKTKTAFHKIHFSFQSISSKCSFQSITRACLSKHCIHITNWIIFRRRSRNLPCWIQDFALWSMCPYYRTNSLSKVSLVGRIMLNAINLFETYAFPGGYIFVARLCKEKRYIWLL